MYFFKFSLKVLSDVRLATVSGTLFQMSTIECRNDLWCRVRTNGWKRAIEFVWSGKTCLTLKNCGWNDRVVMHDPFAKVTVGIICSVLILNTLAYFLITWLFKLILIVIFSVPCCQWPPVTVSPSVPTWCICHGHWYQSAIIFDSSCLKLASINLSVGEKDIDGGGTGLCNWD